MCEAKQSTIIAMNHSSKIIIENSNSPVFTIDLIESIGKNQGVVDSLKFDNDVENIIKVRNLVSVPAKGLTYIDFRAHMFKSVLKAICNIINVTDGYEDVKNSHLFSGFSSFFDDFAKRIRDEKNRNPYKDFLEIMGELFCEDNDFYNLLKKQNIEIDKFVIHGESDEIDEIDENYVDRFGGFILAKVRILNNYDSPLHENYHSYNIVARVYDPQFKHTDDFYVDSFNEIVSGGADSIEKLFGKKKTFNQ